MTVMDMWLRQTPPETPRLLSPARARPDCQNPDLDAIELLYAASLSQTDNLNRATPLGAIHLAIQTG
jgi:hypothetical protein